MSARLTLLQVGHGVCGVLVLGSRKAWVFDCGGDWDIVEAYLRGRIDEIEHLFISHVHEDHVDNLWRLFRAYQIGTLWLPTSFRKFPMQCARALREATKPKAGRRTIRRVQVAHTVNGASREREIAVHTEPSGARICVEVLYPDTTTVALMESGYHSLVNLQPEPQENVLSSVYRLKYETSRVLFPGDTDMSALTFIASSAPARLSCDVLVAPHHGKPENARAGYLSYLDVAKSFGARYMFVPNSATQTRLDSHNCDFLRAAATSGINVKCSELTQVCSSGGTVTGPLRVPFALQGLPDNGRSKRACYGFLEIKLVAGGLRVPGSRRHADTIARVPGLKSRAPCFG
jgi:beta-lactamase superfamily II metal-dependent hydrolase